MLIRALLFKNVCAQNVPTCRFCFKLATQKGNDLLLAKRQKKLGVIDFVLERTCPEKYPKSLNRALLANKATVAVSSLILQLDP